MDRWELAYADARAETEVDDQTAVLTDLASAHEWLGQTIDTITSASLD